MNGPPPNGAAAPAHRPVPRGSGRRTLVLIALVAIAPVVASYSAFYFFHNEHRTNYGVLLPTAPAPALEGRHADGSPFRLTELRGKWVLLAAGGGACAAACRRKLYATRQARAIQGKDQERIERLWLIDDEAKPDAALLAQHPGLVVARVPAQAAAALPGGVDAIYLLDPLGNLVLRYTDDPDIKRLARDLGRLLQASRIG